MTLGERELTYSHTCNSFIGDEATMEVGCALRNVLIRAKLENRLTCGVYLSAKKLDIEPERIMLCLHADLCVDDVALQLHFALMEAFCWENEIRLLKVGDIDSIRKLCEGSSNTLDETDVDPRSQRSHDFSCVLVELPEKMDSSTNALLAHYEHLSEATPFPHVTMAT